MSSSYNGDDYQRRIPSPQNGVSSAVQFNVVEERMSRCNQAWIVLVTTAMLAYCAGLQFILADAENNKLYHLLSIIPGFGIIGLVQFFRLGRLNSTFVFVIMGCLTVELMAVYAVLTRNCVYHPEQFENLYSWGWFDSTFVLNALRMSVPLYVLMYLVLSNFEIDQVVEHKDAANRMLLDLLDIFAMQEAFFGAAYADPEYSPMAEFSAVEIALQVFMTASFLAVVCALVSPLIGQEKESDASSAAVVVHSITLCTNNAPFFALRVYLWNEYNVVVLAFIAKNVWFMLLSVYGLLQQYGRFRDFHKHIQVYESFDAYDAPAAEPVEET